MFYPCLTENYIVIDNLIKHVYGPVWHLIIKSILLCFTYVKTHKHNRNVTFFSDESSQTVVARLKCSKTVIEMSIQMYFACRVSHFLMLIQRTVWEPVSCAF